MIRRRRAGQRGRRRDCGKGGALLPRRGRPVRVRQVLRGACGLENPTVVAVLDRMLSTAQFEIEEKDLINAEGRKTLPCGPLRPDGRPASRTGSPLAGPQQRRGERQAAGRLRPAKGESP